MVAQIQLCNLVDLALCDPEIGAVNFNHLRTLLHAMLKLTNHSNTLVEPKGILSADNILIYDNIDSGSPGSTLMATVIPAEGESNNDERADMAKDTTNDKETTMQTIIDNNNFKDPGLLLNQRKLEDRIVSLEKRLTADEEFPSNYEILSSSAVQGEEASKQDTNSKIQDGSKLEKIWQNKKIIKRLEGAEEAIDKLFSLMNDILNREKSDSLDSEYENLKKQLADLQNHLDQYSRDVNGCKDNIQSNRSLIEELLTKVSDLSESVNEHSKTIQLKTKIPNIATVENKENSSLAVDMDKLVSMLDEKADLCELDNKASISELDKKANSNELDNKANIQELAMKASIEDLDRKANITDLGVMQTEINRLTAEVAGMQEKMQSFANTADLNKMVEVTEFDKMVEKLETLVAKTDDDFSEIRKELLQVNQSIANIDDDKLKDMLDNIEELKNISNIKEEIDAATKNISDLLNQMEQNEKWKNEMLSKLDDLNKVNDNIVNSINDLKLSIPIFDTSVIASIQHLAQENRHQITALQTNLKMLQKLQMPIQSVAPKNDGPSDNSIDNHRMESLQNVIIILQEEQVKMSGHITNMVDDYKEEFNRKQLHIDALYDYIEKLQNAKADKNDITVEMNIKADKQSLDNKVNMSTFDERYQLLEQALQQAFSRLDQYVDQENSLREALSKLNDDMDTKMDSDAGRKLKNFLNERLKALQLSRNQLPDEWVGTRDAAAGLRKPMPLSYNCLSCDRPIDVRMRGVLPPVPNYLPAKNPLGPIKFDKDSDRKNISYDGMHVNRSCGGSHTSVNINMLRMIKLNPLQGMSPDSNEIIQSKSGQNVAIAECVVGNDGQIYRGRFKSSHDLSSQKLKKGTKKGKTRMTHSAKSPKRTLDNPEVDRSHSATYIDKETDSENSLPLPPISQKDINVIIN